MTATIIDTLQTWDRTLFLWLNNLHHPALDDVMIFFTATNVWVPLYILIGISIIVKYKKQSWRYLLLIALIILCSDQFASGLMKPLFERLRPCHESSLQAQIFVPIGCGGQYGFISSHAANTFGLAAFLWLLFPQWRYIRWGICVWASIVSYSRIYVGVHYPADILLGAVAGTLIAILLWRIALHIRFIPTTAF